MSMGAYFGSGNKKFRNLFLSFKKSVLFIDISEDYPSLFTIYKQKSHINSEKWEGKLLLIN